MATSKFETIGEKAGYWVGFWAVKAGLWLVKIGLSLLQIGIAYEVVQIAEGDFQTIVISILGLLYCGLRAIAAEAAVSYYYSGYLTTFTSTRIALYLSSQ